MVAVLVGVQDPLFSLYNLKVWGNINYFKLDL